MFALMDIHPDVSVQESEYKRLLGFPTGHVLEGRSRELADWARRWYAANGKPWIYARQADSLETTEGSVRINGTGFTATQLERRLGAARAHSALLVAVSAGLECEQMARQLWQESKPDEYFFMEMFGSAVVEHLLTATGARLCAWAEHDGMAVLPHDSPGYSGWDISEQVALWKLIRQNPCSALPGEIRVLPTGMLQPKKSLLAVFGITRHPDRVRSLAGLVPCENCSFPRCQYRRAPYRNPSLQIETVRPLPPADRDRPTPDRLPNPALDHQAKYSVNSRALQKWSKERLRLKVLQDGSVEARFRYEGTTCSNLGRPLEYDYHVRLGPPEESYRILETECRPAPGDTGHTHMCEYLNNAEKLTTTMANEKPLLGNPLEDALTWPRPASPSGCYCDAAGRGHKWGLVFEVIHYALVQHEQAQSNPRHPAVTLP